MGVRPPRHRPIAPVLVQGEGRERGGLVRGR